MGNICRSPSAEGFFRRQLASSGVADRVRVDSAGTHGYHVGNPPDHRAVSEAATRGVDLGGLTSRRFESQDFERFDHVVAMDRDNLEILERLKPAGNQARLDLMLDYAPGCGYAEVPDPYYGGASGFKLMCDLLEDATRGLLRHVEAELEAR
jgi:protein-tyrosine phosphatase